MLAPSDDDFYMTAFWRLSSCRRYELGPIPWDRIIEYAARAELQGFMEDSFVELMEELDLTYREYKIEQIDRDRKRSMKT